MIRTPSNDFKTSFFLLLGFYSELKDFYWSFSVAMEGLEFHLMATKDDKEEKTLYKALVDAYETDKDILATYGDTVTLKRRRDNENEDDKPSAGSNQRSKRMKAGKEHESTSAPKDKTYKTTNSSKEGSKSKTRSSDKSALAEEQVYMIKDLEEPAPQEFKSSFTKDHPVDETTQLPDWFQKPSKPPTLDHD
nr:hypothetical protein [Tanacetum cinerariifolium]